MKFTASLVAGLVLTGSLSAQPGNAALEDSLKKHAEILPLKKDARRSVFAVEVSLNSKPLWMVVDSAAESLMFSTEAAKVAEIPLKPATVGQPDRNVAMMVGAVESFALGKSKASSPAMPFMSYSRVGDLMIDGTAHPTAGQIGAGFLKSLKAVADFSNNRLLVPTVALPGGLESLLESAKLPSITLTERNQRLLVPATLQDKEVYFLCGTGATSTSLTAQMVKDLGLTVEEGKDGAPAKVKVPGLKLGVLELKDANLLVTGESSDPVDGKPVAGVIGVDLLVASKALIAFGGNKLFFDAPGE